jgi:Tol biopolymer transport system component
MSNDRFEALERFAPLVDAPEPSFEGFLRRRDRKRRNQRIAAAVVGIAVFVVPLVWIFATGEWSDHSRVPLGPGPSVTVPAVPKADSVIDLDTGVTTQLPEAIIRSLGSLGKTERARCSSQFRHQEPCDPEYAASPDGSRLAYVGTGDEGSLQIFVAGIDGTGIRQMTQGASGAASPAWSPDGTKIAYMGYGTGNVRNLFVRDLFVLDVASGESTQITTGARLSFESGLQFTPDGSSILYTGGTFQQPMLRTVPVAGGKSTLLIGHEGDVASSGNGSLSPDGSLVTFIGGVRTGPGPGHYVANADGTERRPLPGGVFNPAGTWSPDGSRIVCREWPEVGGRIIVIDIATGDASPVAEGRAAIWLDGHTLLVDA